jgi:hypothetical protein
MPIIPLRTEAAPLNPVGAFKPFIPAPMTQNIRQGVAPKAGAGTNMSIFRGKPPNSAPINAQSTTAPITGAYNQQPEYDRLMSQYDSLINKVGGAPSQVPLPARPQNITPERTSYTEDPRNTAALSNMSELAASGGYSAEDKSELRARGISPIRSVYANAQRNADRGRSISGGYSPNAGASSARMAREQAQLVGDQVSNVNAGIAQNVASNRVGLAPQLNAATSHVTDAQNAINTNNAAAGNRASEVNASNQIGHSGLLAQIQQGNIGNTLNQQQMAGSLLSGAGNLYGTTPGRASLFGNQALQQNAQQQNQGQALIDAFLRASRN